MAFTVVFDGDIRSLKQNPLHIKSDFGAPIAIGVGNAFDLIEGMHEVHDAAHKLNEAIEKNLDRADQ